MLVPVPRPDLVASLDAAHTSSLDLVAAHTSSLDLLAAHTSSLDLLADLDAAALWLGALGLAVTLIFGLAALLDAALRRRSAAVRRGVWALAIALALALPLTRLALAAPDLALAPGLAAVSLVTWACGASVLLARLARAHVRARRQRRASAPLRDEPWLTSVRALQDAAGRPRVELRSAPELAGPHTTGVLRPAILVPQRMLAATALERRALLAHELAHVARADCLLLLAGAVARAIYWPTPLAWWAPRRLRLHAQVAGHGALPRTRVPSSSYAAQLVALARDQLGRVGRVAADGLRGRVRGVLDARRTRSPAARRWSLPGLAAAALLGATLITACEASADAPPPATATP